LVVFAAGCASGRHAPEAVISQTGSIGPLHMDRSTRSAVIAFAGRPDAERRGAEGIGPGVPHFRALGYDCSKKPRDAAFGLVYPPNGRAGPFCSTVFWINQRTGRLGDFYTISGRYSESHGVRIGMLTARAERLVHKLAYVGCEENIYLGSGGRDLTIAFAGGSARKLPGSSALHLVGGHVYAFALHGRRNDVGVFDCL
jgi:hypothetical protein